MLPHELIKTARRLTESLGRGQPRQSDLKRAVSTAYYALFHALCRICADGFIGTKTADRSNPAWQQTYRSVEHGLAKNRCSENKIGEFPAEIRNFAEEFVKLQEKRHEADYNPISRFKLNDVVVAIDAAELAIKQLKNCPIKDRRAFAAWVTIVKRKSG